MFIAKVGSYVSILTNPSFKQIFFFLGGGGYIRESGDTAPKTLKGICIIRQVSLMIIHNTLSQLLVFLSVFVCCTCSVKVKVDSGGEET